MKGTNSYHDAFTADFGVSVVMPFYILLRKTFQDDSGYSRCADQEDINYEDFDSRHFSYPSDPKPNAGGWGNDFDCVIFDYLSPPSGIAL